MSEHSPNLNLNLYSEADVKEKFITFLEALAGSSEESNMMLLDAAIKAVRDALPQKADLVDGKIPASQLPSFVDDVVEYSAKAYFPILGEAGKIYVDTSTNLTYRWSGSTYAEISPSLALGETQSTAFRGDLGKEAYEHSLETGNAHGATAADIGAIPATEKGKTNGVATLDETGRIPSGQERINFGVCESTAATEVKAVTIPGITNLVDGMHVFIYFANKNAAESPELSVNGTESTYIDIGGYTDCSEIWRARQIVEFVYHIQNDVPTWYMISPGKATSVYWGMAKVASSLSNDSETGLAASLSLAKSLDARIVTLETIIPDYGTEDLTAGTSTLETGRLYLVYE